MTDPKAQLERELETSRFLLKHYRDATAPHAASCIMWRAGMMGDADGPLSRGCDCGAEPWHHARVKRAKEALEGVARKAEARAEQLERELTETRKHWEDVLHEHAARGLRINALERELEDERERVKALTKQTWNEVTRADEAESALATERAAKGLSDE